MNLEEAIKAWRFALPASRDFVTSELGKGRIPEAARVILEAAALDELNRQAQDVDPLPAELNPKPRSQACARNRVPG